jgi:hypothetical protein
LPKSKPLVLCMLYRSTIKLCLDRALCFNTGFPDGFSNWGKFSKLNIMPNILLFECFWRTQFTMARFLGRNWFLRFEIAWHDWNNQNKKNDERTEKIEKASSVAKITFREKKFKRGIFCPKGEIWEPCFNI